MEHILLFLIKLLKKLSYLGIVLALSCEIVPAEIVLPLAGFWVYEGEMLFWLAVLAGTLGGTLGPLLLYLIGRFGGRPFLLRYGKYLFIKNKQVQKVEDFFRKYGGGVAFFGRFIPGVRTLVPIPCGMAKMNLGLFIFYTFFAMLPITYIYVWLGVKLGPRWKDVGLLVNDFLVEILLIFLMLFAIFMGMKHVYRTVNTTK